MKNLIIRAASGILFVALLVGCIVSHPYAYTLLFAIITGLTTWEFCSIVNKNADLQVNRFIAIPNNMGYMPQIAYYYWYPLSLFIFLWSSDTGAYCFGSLFGKHRLFPRISPKKSWEGSIGGAVVAIVASQIIATFIPYTEQLTQLSSRLAWGGLAAIIVIFGTWGDLVESLLKRKLGIKDSGNIIPGHGGMLDRFDSSLMAIPAAVVYTYTILRIVQN